MRVAMKIVRWAAALIVAVIVFVVIFVMSVITLAKIGVHGLQVLWAYAIAAECCAFTGALLIPANRRKGAPFLLAMVCLAIAVIDLVVDVHRHAATPVNLEEVAGGIVAVLIVLASRANRQVAIIIPIFGGVLVAWSDSHPSAKSVMMGFSILILAAFVIGVIKARRQI